MTTAVYTPDSQLRSPAKLFGSMYRDLAASRELAWRLLVRDIRTRYRQTILGFLWAFLPPVVNASVFVFLNQQGILVVGDTGIPYPAYVMIGTVLWQLFVDSLNAPLNVVKNAKSMLTKVNFPREALILSAAGEVLFNHGIRLVILVAVFVIYQIPLTWWMAASVLGMLCILALGVAIGMLLVPVGLLYADISSALTLIVGLWFYATPVIYPPPHSWPYSLVIDVNPISPLLVGTRDLLTTGMLSAPLPFFVITGITVVGLLVAWVLYRLAIPILTERLGS